MTNGRRVCIHNATAPTGVYAMLQLQLNTDDQIIVTYPDGQQIPIPLHEIQRLRQALIYDRDRAKPIDKMLTFRKNFQAAFTHDDIVKKGAEVRRKHEKQKEDELLKTALRKEREKKLRLKRVEQRDRLKAANELLSVIGL